MPTQMRTLRLDNERWRQLLKLARRAGYEDRSSYIRAICDGELAAVTNEIPVARKGDVVSKVVQAPAQPVQTILPTTTERLSFLEEAPTLETTYDKDFDWGA